MYIQAQFKVYDARKSRGRAARLLALLVNTLLGQLSSFYQLPKTPTSMTKSITVDPTSLPTLQAQMFKYFGSFVVAAVVVIFAV